MDDTRFVMRQIVLSPEQRRQRHEWILDRVRGRAPVPVGVVHPVDRLSILGALAASRAGPGAPALEPDQGGGSLAGKDWSAATSIRGGERSPVEERVFESCAIRLI